MSPGQGTGKFLEQEELEFDLPVVGFGIWELLRKNRLYLLLWVSQEHTHCCMESGHLCLSWTPG